MLYQSELDIEDVHAYKGINLLVQDSCAHYRVAHCIRIYQICANKTCARKHEDVQIGRAIDHGSVHSMA